MRPKIAYLIICVAALCLGCDSLTGSDSNGTKYTGNFSGQLVYTTKVNVTCRTTYNVTGTVEVTLDESATATGEGKVTVNETVVSSDPAPCGGPGPNRHWDGNANITGTTSDLRFTHQYTDQGVVVLTTTTTFAGALSGDVINGVVTVTHSGQSTSTPPIIDSGAATFTVTLR
jgi:hypothetical protein